MNQDVIIDAGLNISQIAGLEKVRAELVKAASEATARGVSRGLSRSVARDNRSVRNLAAADEFNTLLTNVDSGDVKQQLVQLITMRRYLNQVATHNFSTEAHAELAAIKEALNARTNKTRAALRASGALESSVSVTQKEHVKALRRTMRMRQDQFFGALAKVEDKETFDKLDPREQLAIINEADTARQKLMAAGTAIDEYNVRVGRRSKKVVDQEDTELNRQYQFKFDDMRSNIKKTAENTGRTAKLLGTSVGWAFKLGGVGALAAGKAVSELEGFYGSATPFQTARDKIFKYTNWAAGVSGAGAGGGAGALLGALLAPFTGGLSIPVLAGLGALAGGAGTYLWTSSKTTLPKAAAQQSQRTALETMRYRGLYGATAGEGGWQFAKAAAATGLATAEDVAQLASNAQEFQAALAFGGVSDSQMLGMSMLPNYYAAMASGASPEQAFSAYMQDIQGMSPGLAQYASKLAGVPENLRALANNPSVANRLLTEGFSEAASLEAALAPHREGFAHGYFSTNLDDMAMQPIQWKEAMTDRSVDRRHNYDDRFAFSYDESTGQYIRYDASKAPPYTSPTGLGEADKRGVDLVKRELNIYVGEQKTTIGHVYTDKEVNDQISYAIGAM